MSTSSRRRCPDCRSCRLFSAVVGLTWWSLGALIAYELAALMCDHGREPFLLAVGGSDAPHALAHRSRLSTLDDAGFIEALRELGGTPAEVFAHPELLALVLPTLRADFRMLESYTWQTRPPLSCPILTCTGEDDPEVTVDAVLRWSELSTAATQHSVFPGDHFFLGVQEPELVAVLSAEIARTRPGNGR